MKSVDVTTQISFSDNDGESLPITECVCGKRFSTWSFSISIYSDSPTECEYCHRKFYFRNAIRVYEVQDEQES